MRFILLLILLLLVIGALPAWPYSTGWGYYPSGLGVVLLIVLLVVLLPASDWRDGTIVWPAKQGWIFFDLHLMAQWPECVSQFLQAQFQPRLHGPKRGPRSSSNFPVA